MYHSGAVSQSLLLCSTMDQIVIPSQKAARLARSARKASGGAQRARLLGVE